LNLAPGSDVEMADKSREQEQELDCQTRTLVARLRAGEPAAAQRLDQVYRAIMSRFVMGYLHDHEEVEDVIQEVFCRVLRAGRIPEADGFKPWLYRIARNCCLTVLKERDKRGHPQGLPVASRLGVMRTGMLTRLVRLEEQERLAGLVESLPPEQREVLRLRYGEGLSRRDVAEVLGVAESVVKTRLFAGLRGLRGMAARLEPG